MLVLTRKSNQSIMIGDDIEVSVLSVMGEKVRIGIQAPQEVPVFRKEIYLEIHREDGARVDEAAGRPTTPDELAEVDDALRELGERRGSRQRRQPARREPRSSRAAGTACGTSRR